MFTLLMKLTALAMIWHGISFDADYSIDHGFIILALAFAVEYAESKIRSNNEQR